MARVIVEIDLPNWKYEDLKRDLIDDSVIMVKINIKQECVHHVHHIKKKIFQKKKNLKYKGKENVT